MEWGESKHDACKDAQHYVPELDTRLKTLFAPGLRPNTDRENHRREDQSVVTLLYGVAERCSGGTDLMMRYEQPYLTDFWNACQEYGAPRILMMKDSMKIHRSLEIPVEMQATLGYYGYIIERDVLFMGHPIR